MKGIPTETWYHRSLGWHAPALRRAAIVASIGLIVALALLPFMPWELAVVAGWDAAALAFLIAIWPIVIRADPSHTELLATRVDKTRGTAAVLLVAAGVTSLLGVGFALSLAGRQSGSVRILLIGVATLTVLLSWTNINTVFTLRYADLHFQSTAGGIDFAGESVQGRPTYRDLAYVSFTIGMTYQVSDTAISDPRVRGTVLSQAILSYVFGVVIVAGGVNLIAGLAR
ncbi:DUF1345 domain-containing protein [Micromonospora soli]|uniref:DUF1345 domain-containing protein n=1 Tax=Micromonospora sp. NBRC 110009 TaxID=3061627 RepID=UPI002673A251|nr:DUF1345 domain-containing protein [Micromonospora sp. NBRC 110009]WKT98479.1 DUF1345 domain-containing protein [Micromonospora sp. NBRC 110009]